MAVNFPTLSRALLIAGAVALTPAVAFAQTSTSGSANLPPATSADSQQVTTPEQVKPVKKRTHKATAASVAKSAQRNKALKAKPEPGNTTAAPASGD